MASTLAGNLTLLGSIANLIVIQRARSVVRISFWGYFKTVAPLSVATILLGVLWLGGPKSVRADTSITFTKDVAPILHSRCVSCHRPGQVAPFSLITYEDARRRANEITAVTASRVMPPWLPAPGHVALAGERRLSQQQIDIIKKWVRAGAPEGGPADLALPTFNEEWQLGRPDLVAQTAATFDIPAAGPDLYQCFVIPLSLPGDRWVRAMEFRPESRRTVHHAIVFADVSGAARKRDAEADGSGYPCFGVPGFLPTASLGGWSPGSSAVEMPEGVAAALRKGADLVVQVHYHPTGKPETDRSSVALYFSKTPPTRRLMDVALGSRLIDIPPGEARYHVRDHFTLPVDVYATGIIPHAHYICRTMRGVAVLPGGRKLTLLAIDGWDFAWQEQYKFREPVALPAGTRLEMEFVYDNSARNPRNPSSPPKRVHWGFDSTDEMAGLHVQVIPQRTEDAAELGQALWGKFMRSVGGGFYRQ